MSTTKSIVNQHNVNDKTPPDSPGLTRRQLLAAVAALACAPALASLGISEAAANVGNSEPAAPAGDPFTDRAAYIAQIEIPLFERLLAEARQRLAALAIEKKRGVQNG